MSFVENHPDILVREAVALLDCTGDNVDNYQNLAEHDLALSFTGESRFSSDKNVQTLWKYGTFKIYSGSIYTEQVQ